MAVKTITELKEYFQTNKRPTEEQFSDLLDSLMPVSETQEKPYKVFSALLRVEPDMFTLDTYVIRYKLLEPNTLGELSFSITGRNEITIQDDSEEGRLSFEKRSLTIGALRLDYNFDNIFESDDMNDNYIKLIFNYKDTRNASAPQFYNLPIEIRVYDKVEDDGDVILIPGPITPGGGGIKIP